MMSNQLIWPHLFAAGAVILAVLVILYDLWQRLRWDQAIVELREVSHSLETSYGLRSHRELHHSFDGIIRALLELSKNRPAARWVLDELRPVVAQYHRRSVVGSAGAWDEIRNAFLERKRHPVRLTRAAAGWVVLLGLAGTVLGFMEALPALREVLASQADQVSTTSPPAGETSPEAGERTEPQERLDAAGQAALAGQKLNRVLDSLRGVFLATFWGVISAFLLSACNLLLVEPAFDRFADNVDVLGARWFEPLIQPPDTLIDDALRGELRSYFDEIGKRLETVLNPLISQLRLSLEQMSGLASDFSGNIRMGVGTLQTFHAAVKELGGSAQGAVDQLVQIVRTSGDFVREVESLQQKGLDKLTQSLSGPTEVLAKSAAAMDERVRTLAEQILSLDDSSKAIVAALGAHSEGEAALREDISTNINALRQQMKEMSQLRASVDSTAKSLRTELTPLFSRLSQELSDAQALSAKESRSTTEQMAAGVESIRGMLVSLQTLSSPERIREERHALEDLRKAVERLSHQREQQTITRARQTPQPENEEQIRHLKEEIRPMRLQAARETEGLVPAPPLPPPVEISPQAKSAPGGFARFLQWLGFGGHNS